MMMQVILSVPSPSLCCRLFGQLVSNNISAAVANPLNLLLSIVYSIRLSARILAFFFSGEPPAFNKGLFPELFELPLIVLLTFKGLMPCPIFGEYSLSLLRA